jgi:hypothetical protein
MRYPSEGSGRVRDSRGAWCGLLPYHLRSLLSSWVVLARVDRFAAAAAEDEAGDRVAVLG